MKVLVQNKKAFFDYEIIDRLEAGIVLTGDEVKSIKAGHVNLTGSFAHIKDGQLYLANCNVSAYAQAYQKQEELTTRPRKLLLHKRELERLVGDISRKGVTVIPLKLYINERGLVKTELGVAKHKKAADKKQSLKERDISRETAREIKNIKNSYSS